MADLSERLCESVGVKGFDNCRRDNECRMKIVKVSICACRRTSVHASLIATPRNESERVFKIENVVVCACEYNGGGEEKRSDASPRNAVCTRDTRCAPNAAQLELLIPRNSDVFLDALVL